mmetsp:Transcript_1289/g.2708  ORF Transcript_1289/g.2708 Transcript_1289/m.2708 type:complete len:144 (+) Transcript_1289:67-498(+)
MASVFALVATLLCLLPFGTAMGTEGNHQPEASSSMQPEDQKLGEAIACGVRENAAMMQRCGLFCLFNKIPKAHKAISKTNLQQCLVHTRLGFRSKAEALQVFEDWYNKDLAHEVVTVWNNFYIFSAVVGLVILVVLVRRFQKS